MCKNKGYSALQLFFILICAWGASWSTRSFKIKANTFFPHYFHFIIYNFWLCYSLLKVANPPNYGFVSSLLRGTLDTELLSSVNVNGSCMPNSLRSLEQMYAYKSALQGFLGLYTLKVSLVWIIANPSGYSKPRPSYHIWKLWNFDSHK